MRWVAACRHAGIGAFVFALSITCAAAQAPAPTAGCNTVEKPPMAGGASIVQASADNAQQKSWQPRGGDVEFTLKSFTGIPADAQVLACFRWKTEPEGADPYIETRPIRLDRSSDGLILKITTTIPYLASFSSEKGTHHVHRRLGFVPLAEVRILVIGKDGAPVADASTAIGIASKVLAIVLAFATVAFALTLLYLAATWRLTHPNIRQASWLLRIISTSSGRASLSELQIVLWTLLVAGAAVYVMAASGELIQISNGTLVLLGIAGAAGIASKAHGQGQEAAATAAGTAPAETQVPRWSDLLVNESADGRREIDVPACRCSCSR
jgi:hypothetical protein